jgi:hypothetical protein
MALVPLLGVWPASILVQWLLNPYISGLDWLSQAFVNAAGIVVLLTWVIMPVLMKILKSWL